MNADQTIHDVDPAVIMPNPREELRIAATMLRTWIPESFPANEFGQKHFVRAIVESVAEVIERFLDEDALRVERVHDHFEEALRKIDGWLKYRGHEHSPLTEYEKGANDAIDTLALIARNGLDNAIEPKG